MATLFTQENIKEFKNHVVYAATLEMSSSKGVIVPIERDSSGAVHNLVPFMECAKINYAQRFKKMASED